MSAAIEIPGAGLVVSTLRLHPGEDLIVSLDNFVKAQSITAGCIITCLGSLQQAAVRYADQPEAAILNGKFEIVALTGTLSMMGSHLHILLSDSAGTTTGGHLKEGCLVYTTAEIVLAQFPGLRYHREVDPAYGFKELVVTRNIQG